MFDLTTLYQLVALQERGLCTQCIPSCTLVVMQCSVMAAPVANVIVLSDSSDLEGPLVEDEEVFEDPVIYCSLNSEHH